MAHRVLVFVEVRRGEIKKGSLEALSLGRRLAEEAGGSLAAVVVGQSVGPLLPEIAGRGAAAVAVADHPALELYAVEPYAAAVTRAAEKTGAGLLVFAATAMGKDLAPRVAARLDAPYLADCVEAAVGGEQVVVTRPMYAGKALFKVGAPAAKAVLSARPNVFPAQAAAPGATAETLSLDVSDVAVRAKTTAFHTAEKETVDVAEADVIVSGGRGLKGPENFPLVFSLAQALGAGVGASRAVVDAGWIDHDHQVGQTGKTVSPTLYIACGVSGAIQHLAGMRTSKVIVAINKDADAPIFKVADYGVVGDLFEILPRLTEAVTKVRGGA
jgi:electron transfer flavoprotein alpha subunit